VTRNGHYGTPPRQLWRCTPDDGSTPHAFAGQLPRQMLEDGHTCPSCESELAAHQGPPSAPTYAFPVREAAAALVAVGTGATYTEAAAVARVRAGRRVMAAGLGAQLVANWVEVLGPVVTAEAAESEWPETIVCDSTNFMVTNVRTGARTQAFAVLAVWGYPAGAARGRLWSLTASHRARGADWSRVFATLPGRPELVVSDLSGAIHGAVARRWPAPIPAPRNWSPVPAEPFVYRCEHHLRQNALEHFATYGITRDRTAQRLLGKAFKSPQGWAAFRRFAKGYVQLDHWASMADPWLRPQTYQRAKLPQHHANGAAEQAIQQTIDLIGQRAYSFRNEVRTNALLELVRARLNGRADEVAYATAIRNHLAAGGRLTPQLACVDVGTKPRNRQPNQVVPASSLRQ